MSMNERARATRERLLDGPSTLERTDPELCAFFGDFAYDEVLRDAGELDEATRVLVQVAASLAVGSVGAFDLLARAALNVGVTPVQLKEVVYQAITYLGMVRAIDFVHAANALLTERGVELPLPGQSASTPETRSAYGRAVQNKVFGDDVVDAMYAGAREDEKRFQLLASANGFGDVVGRSGLELQTRELLTFAILTALGDTASQLRAHIGANLHLGNTRATLLAALTVLVPYIGYPRVMNAVALVREVTG